MDEIYELLSEDKISIYISGLKEFYKRTAKHSKDLHILLMGSPEIFADKVVSYLANHQYSRIRLENRILKENIFEDIKEHKRGKRLRKKYLLNVNIANETMKPALMDLLQSDKFLKLYEDCFVYNMLTKYENTLAELKEMKAGIIGKRGQKNESRLLEQHMKNIRRKNKIKFFSFLIFLLFLFVLLYDDAFLRI
ncbi:MAG: hypothetical protein AABY22_17380 [Nanoarchaeota archaeon]